MEWFFNNFHFFAGDWVWSGLKYFNGKYKDIIGLGPVSI